MNRICTWAGSISLLIAVVATLLLAEPGASAHPQDFDSRFVAVSLPALRLAKGERVVGFHMDVVSGRIAQISDLPIGWDIEIANDPSWNTSVDGSIRVAPASLDASFFRDFVLIEKEAGADRPFAIKGEVDVLADFAKVRKIPVVMKDVSLRPAGSVRPQSPPHMPKPRQP